jgi:hypothetical protein
MRKLYRRLLRSSPQLHSHIFLTWEGIVDQANNIAVQGQIRRNWEWYNEAIDALGSSEAVSQGKFRFVTAERSASQPYARAL